MLPSMEKYPFIGLMIENKDTILGLNFLKLWPFKSQESPTTEESDEITVIPREVKNKERDKGCIERKFASIEDRSPQVDFCSEQ
ncbi:hypothetical protein RCL_jg25712.t1 [Rhizophagus clarus]|uniref:Uncharacterized protein n=1 Tax=Rhizophagus clarus TaxID=94130 RepID=A0A8H3LTI7_9GLOM|nr:hypothetical protein RCL_jg25712.t1 [Rhizophagus clarus]